DTRPLADIRPRPVLSRLQANYRRGLAANSYGFALIGRIVPLCDDARSSHSSAVQRQHGRSQRGRRRQGGPIVSAGCPPVHATRIILSRCLKTFGGSASSKAKTSPSTGTHLHWTSNEFRTLRQSSSKPTSMSFMPAGN